MSTKYWAQNIGVVSMFVGGEWCLLRIELLNELGKLEYDSTGRSSYPLTFL
jgi:hypothetical protein